MPSIITRSIVFILGIMFIFALCIIAANHAADKATAVRAHGVVGGSKGTLG